MNRLTSSLAGIIVVLLSQGCATLPPSAPSAAAAPAATGTSTAAVPAGDSLPAGNSLADRSVVAQPAVCTGPQCAVDVMRAAHVTEVPVEKNAPEVENHPITSVVVTQCNLIVAVYLTMRDGRLLRFDQSASVPADQLLQMAYTATRSERVEVSCNETGAAGYEKHEPV